MIELTCVSTKDINKVAKIHSNKKYLNWIMKIEDNEYKFYPPLIVDKNTEFDDFEFDKKEEDSVFLDELLEKEKNNNISMFGELWDNTSKFFKEEKFNFVNILESNIDKKRRLIKKCSNREIKLEKYKKYDLAYKKNRVYGSSCISKIEKHKNEIIDNYKVSKNNAFNAKIKKYLEKSKDEIEILSLNEEYIW